MKEKELRECATCAICGNKIGHIGLPLFWRIRIERYGVKLDAIKRQDGLAAMLGGKMDTIKRQDGLATMPGGNSALAAIMGIDEDMAERISSREITVCESCCMKQTCVAELQEATDDRPEKVDS